MGALLVLAITVGYVAVDRLLGGSNNPPSVHLGEEVARVQALPEEHPRAPRASGALDRSSFRHAALRAPKGRRLLLQPRAKPWVVPTNSSSALKGRADDRPPLQGSGLMICDRYRGLRPAARRRPFRASKAAIVRIHSRRANGEAPRPRRPIERLSHGETPAVGESALAMARHRRRCRRAGQPRSPWWRVTGARPSWWPSTVAARSVR